MCSLCIPFTCASIFISDDPLELGRKVVMNAESRSVRLVDERYDIRLVQSINIFQVDVRMHMDPELQEVLPNGF